MSDAHGLKCTIHTISSRLTFFFASQIISQPLLLMWIAASVIIIEGGPTTCPPTHFVKYSSSSGPNRKIVGCRLCPDCSEGQGLSIPCGSQITENTNIECVTCQETKTYSDSHGIENCKPCQQCGSRNVIQECTPTHNRKCGNETSTATTTSIESTATARQDPHHSTTAERSGSIKAYAFAVPATIAIVLAIALIVILCRRSK